MTDDDVLSPIFSPFLKKEKITGKYLAKKIKEELEAKETKFFQHEGRVKEKVDVIAWGVRQRARQDVHKLLGHYPAEKTQMEHSGTVVLAPKKIKKSKDSGK